jgi:hypothetical protein
MKDALSMIMHGNARFGFSDGYNLESKWLPRGCPRVDKSFNEEESRHNELTLRVAWPVRADYRPRPEGLLFCTMKTPLADAPLKRKWNWGT